jgi:hypothetical protein
MLFNKLACANTSLNHGHQYQSINIELQLIPHAIITMTIMRCCAEFFDIFRYFRFYDESNFTFEIRFQVVAMMRRRVDES